MSNHQHEHHPIAQAASVAAGFAVTVQSRVNGELSVRLDSGLQAAVVSFSTGLIAVGLLALFLPQLRQGVSRAVSAVRVGRLRPWQVMGGLVGGVFVAVQSATVPLLGVALFTITIIGAQTGGSVAVDRSGVGPQGVIRPTRNRLLAAVLAVVAVAVSMSGRVDTKDFAWWAVLAAFGVGVAVSFQHSVNGLITREAGYPLAAGFFNFLWGTTLLVGWALIAAALGDFAWQPLPTDAWWLYIGGLLGLGFITVSAAIIHKLGGLRFALGSVAGQLVGAVVLDLVAPTAGSHLSFQLLGGLVITAGAVVLANLRPRPASVGER